MAGWFGPFSNGTQPAKLTGQTLANRQYLGFYQNTTDGCGTFVTFHYYCYHLLYQESMYRFVPSACS